MKKGDFEMSETNKQAEPQNIQQTKTEAASKEAPKKLKTWEEAIRELPSFIQKSKQEQ